MFPFRTSAGARSRAFPPVVFILPALLAVLLGAGSVPAVEELGYWDYHAAVSAAERLDKMALVGSMEDDFGLYAVIGDRFGLIRIYYLTDQSSEEIWSSKQLQGSVMEVIVSDLNQDGDDEIVAWTTSGMIYAWNAATQKLVYETLGNDFEMIHCLTTGNTDEDPAQEIIVNADQKIYYLDGLTFNREWTSLSEYEATRMVCGDVDGDHTVEIVLNTGQVVDSRTGDVEWEDEVFGNRIILMDIDGDGIPEVMSESDGSVMKIFDVDHRKEKHLQ